MSAETSLVKIARPRAQGTYSRIVACGIALVPVALAQEMLTAAHGDSHDGRNGAMWANAADALRADPIGSRFGAIQLDGMLYANHPPGIQATISLAQHVFGSTPVSGRVVALAATALGIVVLHQLLQRLGFGAAPRLLGCMVVATAPMTEVYGSMADTPILAFPFAVAVFALLADVFSGRDARPWQYGAVALGPLFSWQLLLLDVIAVGMLLPRRAHRGAARRVLTLTAAGGSATLAWLVWAHGSLRPMLDQLLFRSSLSGRSELGLSGAIDMQGFAVRTLFGPHLLFVLCSALLIVRSASAVRRLVAAAALGLVVLYDVALSNGAAYHDYWSYLLLVPAGLGTAAFAEQVTRRFGDASHSLRRHLPALLSVGMVVAIGLATTAPQERNHAAGTGAGAALRTVQLASGQEEVWLLAEFSSQEDWVRRSGVPAQHLTPSRLGMAMLRGRMGDVVLVSSSCSTPALACDWSPVRNTPYLERDYSLVTIADLILGRS